MKAATPHDVQAVVKTYCSKCHSEKLQEGQARFDNLTDLRGPARLELLNSVQERLQLQEMPPEDEKQPTAAERRLLAGWVRGEVLRLGGSDFADKLRYPDYGNYVDHDKLFSGQIKDKAYTPARRWAVSPQIFNERVLDVFQLEGREREGLRRGFFGVTNPFVLPEHSGVRYYDLTSLDGGHLLVMLTNADWISAKQIRAARVKSGELEANQFENAKDRLYPKQTMPAFEKIVVKKSPPTEAELVDAIQAQFQCVLQRPATADELKKYLQLTSTAISLGGNTEGLRQMLATVLLESEFLYRLEFGAGPADEFGRKKLSPREASYAIAYAIGDRGPDAKLVAAAQDGRLNNKLDYKREVTRLLDDLSYNRGEIDSSLDGKQFQSVVTPHPKIDRFFRDFFGYTGALKVFKDSQRSGGYYTNPDRGSTQTPGRLVNEADLLVELYVAQDKHVFENLLTTDKFFVAFVDDAGEKMDKLNKFYDLLKDTDWKKNPKKVAEENTELLKKYLDSHAGEKQLTMAMTHVSKFREKGLSPNPVWNYAFGRLLTTWAASYNIDSFNWEFPRVQPFPLANRKGLMTHPAWLIAHSQNAANDPVRRGRWIREKLLAGRVPDVPITVDAQIPEDPHKTLRERLDGVTSKQECWKCHQYMNPLGLPFEIYDDFGRFRKLEILEHPDNLISKNKEGADTYKTKALNVAGNLSGTGDPKLDGDVTDALDLIDRLAKSDRVRQSIIRHAFRFYMGRNEMLSDSQTLIDADRAYVDSQGSFKAVIVSLLTSDSFIYRK